MDSVFISAIRYLDIMLLKTVEGHAMFTVMTCLISVLDAVSQGCMDKLSPTMCMC